MNQINGLRPINTIVSHGLVRGDLQEVPKCGICFDTQKKVNCIGSDRIVCHRAPPSERNPENIIYHPFHKTCLGEWLITPNSKNKCPNCQTILSNESIEQELALSPMEKGVQMAENLLKWAVRGAFYGAWSWAATYTLIGHQTDLGDFSSNIIISAVTSSIICPLIAKSIAANPDFVGKLRYAAIPIAAILWSFPSQETGISSQETGIQETNIDARLALRSLVKAVPLMLGRSGMGMVMPELSNFERELDNWSWKAVPGLALGVASRMLFKWWGSS